MKTRDKILTVIVENYGGAGPAQLHEIERKIDEVSKSESLWKE